MHTSHFCLCVYLQPQCPTSSEAYQYKEIRWSRHAVLPGKNRLHVPGHQSIEHGVKQQQAQHLGHGEVIIHRHRVK